MGEGDATTFPTYHELTQTQGWTTVASGPVQSALEPGGNPALDKTGELTDPSLARYTERALLGKGGMGTVLLAHDARVGRDVALKQLHAERELGADEHRRFLREARVQGQLEHPSIVPVYDIDRRPDGSVFFTMRRVLGRTLQQIVEELKLGAPAAVARYTQRELLTAFGTICLTVDYAHSRGVVHRDLKPANVMLGDFGEVYVLDWGLARVLEEEQPDPASPSQRLSMTGELLGTPLYMAPEQMADSRVGPAADVFSLGALLFELLTLERLRDPKSIYSPPDARPSVRAPDRQIDPELETICVRATEAEPSARYASPRALQEAIVGYLEGDRDREQRRRLAATHAQRSHEAHERLTTAPNDRFEVERGDALREIARAVALDPTNQTYHAALATTLAEPPRAIPPEVHEELRAETQRVIRSGLRQSVIGMLSWFLFAPVALAIGITNRTTFGLILGASFVALVLCLIGVRTKVASRGLQLSVVAATLVAAMMTSRIYGPLVLMPTLIASYTITIHSHPWRLFRRFGLAVGATAMVLPTLLELAGVLPASYSFSHGLMSIRPQVLALPHIGTTAFLALANVAMLVVPCLFIAQLRSDLSDVQVRQLLQKWQLRRLRDELQRT